MFAEYRHIFKAIGCFLTALLLCLSLVSYSSYDPSFNRVSEGEIYNLLGIFGSYLADLCIQMFGWASLIVVPVLLAWCKRYVHDFEVERLFLRFGALITSLVLLSGILSYVPTTVNWPLYIGFGGIVGDQLHAAFNQMPGLFIISILVVLWGATTLYALTISAEHVLAAFQWLGYVVQASLEKIAYGMEWLSAKLRRDEVEEDEDDVDEDEEEIDEDEGDEDEEIDDEEEEDDEELEEDEDDELLEEEDDEEDEEEIEVAIPSKKQKMASLLSRSHKKKNAKAKKIRARDIKVQGGFVLPGLDLLVKEENASKNVVSQSALQQKAKLLARVLNDFGVDGQIIRVRPGPVVTLYELEPSPGTKSSRVIGLADDIARSMSAVSARISVIPGRNVLGIELPNKSREIVYLRELMETEEYQDEKIRLPMALGKDIGGEPITVDLAKMPHLLVAGTTGSGKSVAVNAMILSLLYRLTPEECKFIMIDPKMLELSVYQDIPHLLTPVVTEPGKAVVALKWAVREMEERYRAMSHVGVRNISGYNKRIEEAIEKDETLERQVQTGFDPETGEPIYETQELPMRKLPSIVIIVDEMADLMLTAGKDIESSIQRLAQMARAAGIHMIMATQRPSVDVITGVIKANFPTRISFQVTSRIDSRTILGEMGAEQLLGMGDMLYMAGGTRITRVHGPFVDDKEVEKVVNHLKAQDDPDYIDDVTKEDAAAGGGVLGESGDELYDKAVAIVLRDKKASTSYIQRQLKIGYNRAANIIEQMEQEGVISEAGSGGKREILVS